MPIYITRKNRVYRYMKKSSDSTELMNLVLTLAAIFSMVLTTLKIIEWMNLREGKFGKKGRAFPLYSSDKNSLLSDR